MTVKRTACMLMTFVGLIGAYGAYRPPCGYYPLPPCY